MVGMASREFLVQVMSTGTTALTIGGLGLAGTDPEDFRLTPLSCTRGGVLDVGARCELQVGFVPSKPGRRQAVLRIQHDDPAQTTLEIPLTGDAVLPAGAIEISPASVDFGLQPTQVASTPQQVTVRNNGLLRLNITSVTAGSDFTVAENCTAAPLEGLGTNHGRQCSIDVQFAPIAPGPQTAQLKISSDDPEGPVLVELKGLGAGSALTVSSAAINFGSHELGAGSGGTRPLKLENTGAAALNVSGVTLTGSQAGDFTVSSGACTAQAVAPNAACAITVRFVPGGFGHRAAALSIASNAPGAATAVSLSGFGEFFAPIAPAPPIATDHGFVKDNRGMACSGHGTPIRIDIPVTRAMAPSLVAPAVAAGTLFSTATLELMVVAAGPAGAHSIFLDGTSVGTTSAPPAGWHLESFTVPIAAVRFPSVTNPGFTPTPATLQLRVDPDIHQAGNCVVVAWARLSILAMSPVVLIHGNNSDGVFFTRQTPSFVSALNALGIANDSSINFVPSAASIAANARTLQSLVPPIARRHGVDTVHLIAHSKGGLDARAWLSANATANALTTPSGRGFRVISLTTLSTPHRGSALADLSMAIDATSVGLFGIQLISGFLNVSDLGIPDLTTFSTAGFNPPLPSNVDYLMVGADMDRNGDGLIRSAPVDEYAGARTENLTLRTLFGAPPMTVGGLTITGPQLADELSTALYEFLRNTRRVDVRMSAIGVPLPIPPFFVVVTVTHAVPIPGAPAPNDILVTAASATGAPGPFGPSMTFGGPAAGRDHGSIADGGVGTTIIPFLAAADRARGGLR